MKYAVSGNPEGLHEMLSFFFSSYGGIDLITSATSPISYINEKTTYFRANHLAYPNRRETDSTTCRVYQNRLFNFQRIPGSPEFHGNTGLPGLP